MSNQWDGQIILPGSGLEARVLTRNPSFTYKQKLTQAVTLAAQATTTRTFQQAFKLPAGLTRFRVAIPNINAGTQALGGIKAVIVSATTDFPNAHTFTPVNVLFSAATTATLATRVSATEPSITYSDWIDVTGAPVGSFLVLRGLLTGTVTWNATYSTFAGYTDALANALYPAYTWHTTVDWFTAMDSWNTTAANAVNQTYLAIIEMELERQSLAVAAVGDSHVAGSLDSGTVVSPIWTTADALTSDSLLVSPLCFGWGGQDSVKYSTAALWAAANLKPAVLCYQVSSQNDTGTIGDAQINLLMRVAKACYDNGVRLILINKIPTNASTLSADNERKALNVRLAAMGLPTIDVDAVVSDGASPARYKSEYGTGTHLNAAGMLAVKAEYLRVISNLSL